MYVLGLESSCDETAVAIYHATEGLLVHRLFSQIDLHQCYGGVVPELAARDHVRKALPLISALLKEANLTADQLNGVAYTAGPGLVGALMVGAALGQSLAYGWGIPAIGVHHMEAHLMAVMLEPKQPSFPFLALLVSGGHTLLVAVKAFGEYEIVGQSVDDAVGEAFDKTAKLMGLPYPGGPAIAQLALQGDPQSFVLPRPMVNRPGCDFSFSGLKTHVANCYYNSDQSEQTKANLAAAFQEAVVDTLVIKCQLALTQTGLTELAIVGGVSANQLLRERCQQVFTPQGVQVYYPRPAFCTDNGAMVAYTGYLRLRAGACSAHNIGVRARWDMSELTPPAAAS